MLLKPTQPGTACMVCLTPSTREKSYIYSTLFGSSNRAVTAVCYPDYCCMHRVCACRGSQVAACRSFNRTHLTRYIDVQQYTGNILGNLFWSYAAVCCYLLAVVLQLPAQGFVQHTCQHSQVQAADRHNSSE
jgi:hypothetical protein